MGADGACQHGEGEMNWQPIETAPKDGEMILVFERLSDTSMDPQDHNYSVAYWCDDRWVSPDEIPSKGSALDLYTITHWMALPEPPK